MTEPSQSGPWWVSPRSLPTQELRIAASFSGGVSLAIWMGGLTYELDRLLRSSDSERARRHGDTSVPPDDDRYAALLSLLAVDLDVDVITGTSAGGINGAALATARAHGSSLSPLRDVWLDKGSFSTLLRPLDEAKPLSLLQGDGVLLAGLQQGLEKIEATSAGVPGSGRRTAVGTGEPFPSRENAMRLIVTATMTSADVTTVRDALGTAVYLEDNQALFTFEQPAGTAADPGNLTVPQLARAARSSASYPAAFEPSFVRVGGGPGSEPDLGPHLGIHSSRWMIDGGLRNNQPVGTALRAVWEQPAGEGVRRVLLHVVPNPGTPTAEAASTDDPPALFRALGMTVAAPFVQTWRADLEATRRQSLGASRRRAGLTRVHDLVTGNDGAWPTLAAALRETRSQWVAEDFLTALDAQLSRFAKAGQGPAAAWSVFSSSRYEALRSRCVQEARGHWDAAADGVTAPDLAHYGPDLYNACLGILLRELRERESAGEAPPPGVSWAQAAQSLHQSRQSGHLTVRFERDLLVGFLKTTLTGERGVREEESVEWATGLFRRWLDRAFPRPDADAAVAGDTDQAAGLRASWEELLVWVHGPALQRRLMGADVTDPDAAARQLLARGAVDVLTLSDGRLAEQTIDLVQLSGFTRTGLAPDLSTPAEKLMGVGMAHFGAFVRRSWRANDWMWGRLDGAGWLVHLLLAPERLRAVAAVLAPDEPRRRQVDRLAARLATIACARADGSVDPELAARWDEAMPAIRPELDALATDETSIQSLPNLSMALAYCLQRDIAAQELPVVAQTMQQSESGRSVTPRTADDAFVRAVRENLGPDGRTLRPEAVRPAMSLYSVMRDTQPADLLADRELRSTLFDALAVGASAVDTSTPRGAPVLPQALATTRRATLGLARSVRSNSVSGWASVVLLALGVVLILAGGAVLTAAGVPLVVGGIVSLVLTGLGSPSRLAGVQSAVLWVGVVASVLTGWWVSSRLSEDRLEQVSRDLGPPLVWVSVALAGIALTAATWWLLRAVGRLMERRG
jgi:patatin-related protein